MPVPIIIITIVSLWHKHGVKYISLILRINKVNQVKTVDDNNVFLMIHQIKLGMHKFSLVSLVSKLIVLFSKTSTSLNDGQGKTLHGFSNARVFLLARGAGFSCALIHDFQNLLYGQCC